MQVVTSYSSHPRTGAGRVTAVVTDGEHKRRQVTVAYDHAAGRSGSHEWAVEALCLRLGVVGKPTYIAMNNAGGCVWNVA